MHTRRFDCTKFGLHTHKGEAITSFKLRETTGPDEDAALQRVLDAYGTADVPKSAHQKVGEGVIADSFVEVNDLPVVAPYAWNLWPTRTRSFVEAAFNRLNGATKDEIDSFLAGDDGRGPASKPASP